MDLAVAGLDIADQVRRVIDSEGITLPELDTMVQKAAITTHERGNRRFHAWIFDIHHGVVIRMSHDTAPTATYEGQADLTVYEECEHCEGESCKQCGYTGEIKTTYTKRKK